jgi:hypothetical protein
MAQAESITTATCELMSRGRPPKSTTLVRVAHTELIAAIAANPPRPICVAAESDDLDRRADHLENLLAAVRNHVSAIFADTAENIPGSALDVKYLEGAYADFCSDAVGSIRNAAEKMREHETWGAS